MALELDITQPNYGRLEKDDSRLNAPKLIAIAKVLDVTVSYLFGEKAANVIHNNNGDNAQASIGTVVQEKEHIKTLKDEIAFLRGLLKEKVT